MLRARNARARVVVDYGVDPNNPSEGLIRDTYMRLAGFLVPVVAGGDTDPGNQYFGTQLAPQDFIGAANPASTTVITRNGGNATIDSPIAGDQPMNDPAMRIFADRLRRRAAL